MQQSGRQLGIATLTGDQERAVCEFARCFRLFTNWQWKVLLFRSAPARVRPHSRHTRFYLLSRVTNYCFNEGSGQQLPIQGDDSGFLWIGTAGKRHARRDTGWTISVSLYNTRSSRRQCLAHKYVNGECVAGKLGGFCHRRSTLHQDLERQ